MAPSDSSAGTLALSQVSPAVTSWIGVVRAHAARARPVHVVAVVRGDVGEAGQRGRPRQGGAGVRAGRDRQIGLEQP